MTPFVNILLAALSIVAPQDGVTVPTLRGSQKAYLSVQRKDRFKVMENAGLRQTLVARGATQQPLRLEWTGDTNAECELTVKRVGGERQTFSLANRTHAYITNLELGAKYLWAVVDRGNDTKAVGGTFETEPDPPRLLRADGVMNLRDLGGWKGLKGKRVRQNMIFRSAGLRSSAKSRGGSLFGGSYSPGEVRISEAGIETLRHEFKVKTDIELRSKQEAACMTSSILGEGVTWVHVPFAAYDFIDNPVRGREPFAQVFKTFTDPARYPILFHCSGGRDRTGTLAFLLNGLLGVDGDDLCKDWEATIFTEGDVKFGTGRIDRLLKYLHSIGGETVAEQCERYALSCGVTKEQIEKFRGIMLEGGN